MTDGARLTALSQMSYCKSIISVGSSLKFPLTEDLCSAGKRLSSTCALDIKKTAGQV
jgi:hypothetical protein